jgi:hypothetical protein
MLLSVTYTLSTNCRSWSPMGITDKHGEQRLVNAFTA